MPLVYQHNINESTRLGVWHITEAEDFFLQRVPLKKDVSHPHKRLQHLAGRYLLPALFNDFPLKEILIADTRKPFLEKEQYHFSISHCREYAAAIVSSRQRVGVDIELITPRIGSVAKKFLHETEQQFLQKDDALFLKQWGLKERAETEFLTLMWSAKEAIFKWYSKGEMDFREHMQLHGDINYTEAEIIELPFLFKKEKPLPVMVHARLIDDFVLAWLYT